MPFDRIQWEEHGHLWGIHAEEAASESNHITKQLSLYSHKHQGRSRSGETESIQSEGKQKDMTADGNTSAELGPFVRKYISTRGLLKKLRWGTAWEGMLASPFSQISGGCAADSLWEICSNVLERNGPSGHQLTFKCSGEMFILHLKLFCWFQIIWKEAKRISAPFEKVWH